MAEELKPCPFCGYKGIHFRRKSGTRESVTGAMADIAQDWGPSYEAHVADWRFGVKCYCGRCRANTGYQWGKWHIPTESEIDCYGDIAFRIPEQYDSYEYRDDIVEAAIAAWNRRADAHATTRRGKYRIKYGRRVPLCECCGYSIGDLRWKFCPSCGAEVTDG